MNNWIQSLTVGVGLCVGFGGCTAGGPGVSFDFATEKNPTTFAGRGAPSLEDRNRPAAWIFIDGEIGTFKERDGQPLLQWFIEKPVRSAPSFRVEAFKPLLGSPTDFKCVLQTYDSPDGVQLTYAIRSRDGTFRTGRDYSLLAPGADFVIVDRIKNEALTEIPPLPPGTYGLAAGVTNIKTGAEALAVTYFTVGANGKRRAWVAGARESQ